MRSENNNSFMLHLPMGCARPKTLCNTTGQPVDDVFLEVNPADEIMTGLLPIGVALNNPTTGKAAGFPSCVCWKTQLG